MLKFLFIVFCVLFLLAVEHVQSRCILQNILQQRTCLSGAYANFSSLEAWDFTSSGGRGAKGHISGQLEVFASNSQG